MSMFSNITTAPAKQSASEAITVLSGRLSTSTLLEDRRAAILSLRSFAKQYPATVASSALRSLISSLDRDGEDVDTVKVVLETLLMLFQSDPTSAEASEEIALWVADEFTQRHENIGLLLGFLDKERLDFYSRLYSLQLLFAILSARTERTEECISSAPEGVARIVAALDDQRDAIRDEAVGLLTELTPTSTHIQGLVAYENVFGRIFEIIKKEGGLAFGARVVEDCLILLANLLRLNPTNQTMFRDMGYVSKIGELLRDAYGGGNAGEEVADWVVPQRNRNVYAILAVIRLFLVPGSPVTAQNQEAFLGDLIQKDRGRGGRTSRARNDPVLFETLQIAFSHAAELPIKSEALLACADIIRGNAAAQEAFASIQVPSPLDGLAMNGEGGHANGNGIPKVYVIDGLLDLVLAVNTLQAFDLRLAGCVCLKAYFYQHAQIRMHFLDHAIRTHNSNADGLTNVLTILLQPAPELLTADPYKYWFAAVLMLHLLNGNPEAKALAMSVTEGDQASGEEVVTGIQTIAAHLISSVTKSEDPRVSIGYLMLLLCWLFENLAGVHDFLEEFTNLQGLIQAAIENPHGDPIVQGLSAMLVGVVYEFSTKDSPLPRATVREQIMTRMTRDRYVDKLSKLRAHPMMRDFEVLPQKLEQQGMDLRLPDVFLDETFVEFFKDNYSRILRAIDRDPDWEVSVVVDGVEQGVSRQLVDELRQTIDTNEKALKQAEDKISALNAKLSSAEETQAQFKNRQSAELTRAQDTMAELRAQLAIKDRAVQTAQAQTANLERQLAAEKNQHQMAKAIVTKTELENRNLVALVAERDQKIKAQDAALARSEQRFESALAAHQKLKAESIARQDEMMAEANNRMQTLGARLAQQEENAAKADECKRIAERELERVKGILEGELADAKSRLVYLEERAAKAEEGKKCAEQESERMKGRFEGELADAKATISRLEVDLMKGEKAREGLEGKITKLEGEKDGLAKEVEERERKVKDGERKLKEEVEKKEKEMEGWMEGEVRRKVEKEVRIKVGEMEKKVKEEIRKKEEERKAVQEELDDLLIVFADVEEKAKNYKVCFISRGG